MHDIMGLRKCQYGTAAEQPLLEILTATLSCKFWPNTNPVTDVDVLEEGVTVVADVVLAEVLFPYALELK